MEPFSHMITLFEVPVEPVPGGVGVFGVAYDGTTCFRPGTRFGPDAIRAVSEGIEYYSPTQDRDIDEMDVADLGNLDVPHSGPEVVVEKVRSAVFGLFERGVRPFMLGGEHSLTAGAVEAACRQHPDLVVVQLDAHADLRDAYLGERYSHACAMRRCLDVLRPDSLLQVGIRSGTRAEYKEMRATGRLVPPRADALQQRLSVLAGRPIYLTIDLDVFDPAAMPGTGTPEPGGIDWPTFTELLACLPGADIVAADVMELSPYFDASGCSAVLGAKVVREVLLKMGE